MTVSAQPPGSAAPTARKRKPRKKLGAGWLPQAHGAWAMLFLPYLVAVVIRIQEGGIPAYVWPLLPTWLLGYFAYNALSLWLKSGRKEQYLRPLAVYGAAAGLFGGLTLWLQPALFGWALAFAPLLGIGLWRASQRDDASLLARGSAVIAACLVCAVVAAGPLTEALSLPLTHRVWLSTLVLWGYFIGTLLYVKTMIRERGSARFLGLSVGYHFAVTLLALWGVMAEQFSMAVPAFFALVAVRSLLMPQLEQWTGKRTTPKQVGLLEFANSLVLLGVLSWGV